MLTVLSSPSQYSAQLKVWGLRTYKIKATVPTDCELTGSDNLLEKHTEISPSTPLRQVYSRVDLQSDSQSSSHVHNSFSHRSSGTQGFTSRSVGGNEIGDGPKRAVIEAWCPDSLQSYEAPPLSQEQDGCVPFEQSPSPSRVAKSPQNAQQVYPLFNAPETIENAVRRVVQALSEVLTDPELEEFLDNLSDMDLDELLINHVKVKDACEDALAKHTGRLLRVGQSFGPRPTRLVQIVGGISSHLYSSPSHLSCSVMLLKIAPDVFIARLRKLPLLTVMGLQWH